MAMPQSHLSFHRLNPLSWDRSVIKKRRERQIPLNKSNSVFHFHACETSGSLGTYSFYDEYFLLLVHAGPLPALGNLSSMTNSTLPMQAQPCPICLYLLDNVRTTCTTHQHENQFFSINQRYQTTSQAT